MYLYNMYNMLTLNKLYMDLAACLSCYFLMNFFIFNLNWREFGLHVLIKFFSFVYTFLCLY